jgi:hypothetical protein
MLRVEVWEPGVRMYCLALKLDDYFLYHLSAKPELPLLFIKIMTSVKQIQEAMNLPSLLKATDKSP